KEHDAAARPAAQFNVVDALPDSVLSGRAVATEPPATPAPAATPAPKARPSASRRVSKSTAHAADDTFPEGVPPGAQRSALPLSLSPQLATLVDVAPPGEGWLYELKF